MWKTEEVDGDEKMKRREGRCLIWKKKKRGGKYKSRVLPRRGVGVFSDAVKYWNVTVTSYYGNSQNEIT